MTTTVRTEELRYTYGKSNKYWRYYTLDNTHWVAEWGRIGTAGQRKIMLMGDVHYMDRRTEKRNEGYTVYVPAFTFDISDIELGAFKQSVSLVTLSHRFEQTRSRAKLRTKPTQATPVKKPEKRSQLLAQLDAMLKQNET
jgi:predicted DNA-binding WGR domain protein